MFLGDNNIFIKKQLSCFFNKIKSDRNRTSCSLLATKFCHTVSAGSVTLSQLVLYTGTCNGMGQLVHSAWTNAYCRSWKS